MNMKPTVKNEEPNEVVVEIGLNGFILNNEVFLDDMQWNTIMRLSEKICECFVCDQIFEWAIVSDHLRSHEHLNRLHMHSLKVIPAFHSMTLLRKRGDHFHCPYCNTVLDLTKQNHFKSKTHKKAVKRAKKITKSAGNNDRVMHASALDIGEGFWDYDGTNGVVARETDGLEQSVEPVFVDKNVLRLHFAGKSGIGYLVEGVGYVETSTRQDDDEMIMYELSAGKISNVEACNLARDEERCWPTNSDEETNGEIPVQRTSDGVIVNQQLYLDKYQWNTLVYIEDGVYQCFVCETLVDEVAEHIEKEEHLNKLEVFKPFLKDSVDANIIRMIENTYHCAVCNIIIDVADTNHFRSDAHDQNIVQAIENLQDVLATSDNCSNADSQNDGTENTDSDYFNIGSGDSSYIGTDDEDDVIHETDSGDETDHETDVGDESDHEMDVGDEIKSVDDNCDKSTFIRDIKHATSKQTRNIGDASKQDRDVGENSNHDVGVNDVNRQNKSSDGRNNKSKRKTFATIAKTPKNIDVAVPKFVDKVLDGRTIRLAYETWHMVIKPKPNTFYCMACKDYFRIWRLLYHCEEDKHLYNLSQYTVISTHDMCLIRKVDDKLCHCGCCNSLQVISDLHDHLDSHYHTESPPVVATTSKNSINNNENKAAPKDAPKGNLPGNNNNDNASKNRNNNNGNEINNTLEAGGASVPNNKKRNDGKENENTLETGGGSVPKNRNNNDGNENNNEGNENKNTLEAGGASVPNNKKRNDGKENKNTLEAGGGSVPKNRNNNDGNENNNALEAGGGSVPKNRNNNEGNENKNTLEAGGASVPNNKKRNDGKENKNTLEAGGGSVPKNRNNNDGNENNNEGNENKNTLEAGGASVPNNKKRNDGKENKNTLEAGGGSVPKNRNNNDGNENNNALEAGGGSVPKNRNNNEGNENKNTLEAGGASVPNNKKRNDGKENKNTLEAGGGSVPKNRNNNDGNENNNEGNENKNTLEAGGASVPNNKKRNDGKENKNTLEAGGGSVPKNRNNNDINEINKGPQSGGGGVPKKGKKIKNNNSNNENKVNKDGITEVGDAEDNIHYVNAVTLVIWGQPITLPILNFHAICLRLQGFYCGLCDVVSSDHPALHMCDARHLFFLREYVFIPEFGPNAIRFIRGALHCGLCNIPIAPHMIQTHLHQPNHLRMMSTALTAHIVTSPKPSHEPTKPKASQSECTKDKTANGDCQKKEQKEKAGPQNEKKETKSQEANVKTEAVAGNNIEIKKPRKSNKRPDKEVAKDQPDVGQKTDSNVDPVGVVKRQKPEVPEPVPEVAAEVGMANVQVTEVQSDFETFFESNVYVRIDETFFKISKASFNTVIVLGNGSFYCFVCGKRILMDCLGVHVGSAGHTSNLETKSYLFEHVGSLLRQNHLNYHCGTCNLMFTRVDLQVHLDWKTHHATTEASRGFTKKHRQKDIRHGAEKVQANTVAEVVCFDVEPKQYLVVGQESCDGEHYKVVQVQGKLMCVPWNHWHGLVMVENGWKCVVCQTDTVHVSRHISDTQHVGAVSKPLADERNMMREALTITLLHCLVCNTALPNNSEAVYEHVRGKKHKKAFVSIKERS